MFGRNRTQPQEPEYLLPSDFSPLNSTYVIRFAGITAQIDSFYFQINQNRGEQIGTTAKATAGPIKIHLCNSFLLMLTTALQSEQNNKWYNIKKKLYIESVQHDGEIGRAHV